MTLLRPTLVLFYACLLLPGAILVWGNTLASKQGIARMAFKDLEHDFGHVGRKGLLQHDFEFTNTGTVPVMVGTVLTSCGCLVSTERAKFLVLPGQSESVSITLDTSRVASLGGTEFVKTARVDFETPSGRSLATLLTIRGVIHDEIHCKPSTIAVQEGVSARLVVTRDWLPESRFVRLRCMTPSWLDVQEASRNDSQIIFEFILRSNSILTPHQGVIELVVDGEDMPPVAKVPMQLLAPSRNLECVPPNYLEVIKHDDVSQLASTSLQSFQLRADSSAQIVIHTIRSPQADWTQYLNWAVDESDPSVFRVWLSGLPHKPVFLGSLLVSYREGSGETQVHVLPVRVVRGD